MEFFRELSNVDQKVLDIDSSSEHEHLYLYSSEKSINMEYAYLSCNSCGTEIVCRAEDIPELLKSIREIKCPECSASVVKGFNLSLMVKEIVPLLDELLVSREEE